MHGLPSVFAPGPSLPAEIADGLQLGVCGDGCVTTAILDQVILTRGGGAGALRPPHVVGDDVVGHIAFGKYVNKVYDTIS